MKVVREIDLTTLALRELTKIKANRIIPFPIVYYRLGCIFHFDKEISRLVLKDLEKKKLIRVHNFHGVEILQTR